MKIHSKLKNALAITSAATMLLTAGFMVQPTRAYAEEQAPLGRAEIEKIVREYLIANPEILFEVQQAFEQKQRQQMAEQQQQVIKSAENVIYDAPYQIEIGSADAPIRIVEFFDYNCGYCKRAMSDMQQLLEKRPDVRFILKEYPVLGQGSLEATRVSMAVSKVLPDQHAEFHIKLLGLDGQKDGERAMQLAEEMGADMEKLVAEMENPKIMDAITQTYELANSLGINGTPSYILGETVLPGAVGLEELSAGIDGLTN